MNNIVDFEKKKNTKEFGVEMAEILADVKELGFERASDDEFEHDVEIEYDIVNNPKAKLLHKLIKELDNTKVGMFTLYDKLTPLIK